MSEKQKLPDGWVWTTLRDLEVFSIGGDWGQDPAQFKAGLTPTRVIRATEFKNWAKEKGKTSVERLIDDKKLLNRKLQKNDFVIEVSGGGPTQPVGRAILIDEAALSLFQTPSICSNFCRLLRLSALIDSAYIQYFLSWSYATGATNEYQTNTTNLRNLNFGRYLEGLQVPLPPYDEQSRIVRKLDELLSELDAGLDSIRLARAKVKAYRASLLKAATNGELSAAWRAEQGEPEESGAQLLQRILDERRSRWEEAERAKRAAKGKTTQSLFEDESWKEKYVEPSGVDVSDLPELPASWAWASTSQLGEIKGGIQKQPKRAPSNNHYPYLRVGNVLRNRLDLSRIERMELFGEELTSLSLKSGDLLVVEGNGSKHEIGRSAIWSNQIPDCVHQNHIIRVRPQGINPEYLNFFWNSPEGIQRITKLAATTSGLYTLSVAKIAKIVVPLPPLDEQYYLCAEVDRCLSLAHETEAALDANEKRAQTLRQAILRAAFSGQLVPQDPNDESAEVLLEQIRELRAATTVKAKTRAPKVAKVKSKRKPSTQQLPLSLSE